MNSRQRSPVWPYLGVLACLFILSVSAPRAWQRIAQREAQQRARAQQAAQTALEPRPQATEFRAPLAPPIAAELDAPATLIHEPSLEPDIEPVVVEPAGLLARQVVEPEYELANRPSVPRAEPEMPRAVLEPRPQPAPAVETRAAWAQPAILLDQLKLAAHDAGAEKWTAQVGELLNELADQGEGRRSSAAILRDLRGLERAAALAPAPADRAAATAMLRAQYSLRRRLDVWDKAIARDDSHPPTTVAQPQAAQQLSLCLADLEDLTTGKGRQGAAWREYLLVERLRELAGPDGGSAENERRKVARQVLARMARARSGRQREFVAQAPVAQLASQMHRWAAEPVEPTEMLDRLERYERSGLPSDAKQLANDCRQLAWSDSAESQELAQQLAGHYRNANLRIAVAGALMGRFLPPEQRIQAPVQDTVVGVPVVGQSTTFTKLAVKLIPDKRNLRVALEAVGVVASGTSTTSGPATLFTQGQSSFEVGKLFLFSARGLRSWPAVSQADGGYSNLVSLETDYDNVLLIGQIVRNVARSQHADAQEAARMEVEQKIATRARETLDLEMAPRVALLTANFQRGILAPLERLGLEATPLETSTTEQRVMMRLRLGGEEQLGAHTTRPRAPSDSMLSMQVHQSAFNNALERLELEGRSFTLPELCQWIGDKTGRPLTLPDDVPEGLQIRFADRDAMRVECQQGRLTLVVSLAELSHEKNHWRNFSVRAHYRPQVEGLQAGLVRDGSLSLEGASLKGRPQILLRTIFAKVLSSNRSFKLIDEKLTSHAALKNLEISQCVVEDGWIGLAYSGRRADANNTRRTESDTAKRPGGMLK